LNQIDFDVDVGKRRHRADNLIAAHGEQPDFGFQREPLFNASAGHLLVVPDNVLNGEGDLLPRLVLDDVGNLLRFDRR